MPYFGFGYLNIPIKSINMDVGQRIANEIGESLLWIIINFPKSGMSWKPFVRIRVNIHITIYKDYQETKW